MIVTQPERVLLMQQLSRHAPKLFGKLLDVGGGQVRRYKHLCPKVTEYKTLDINADWKPDIVGSAEAIPLPDASVDSILSTQVLEHVPHPWIAIKEMARILKPGGIAVITVPQWNELHEEPHDYFRYTRFGLESMFKDSGLHVETMEQRGQYFSVCGQAHIRLLIDRFQPYKRTLAMFIIAPWSLVITKLTLGLDRLFKTKAHKKHVLGWCVVVRKS